METINFQNYRIIKDEKEIRGAIRPIARIFKETPKGKYSKEKLISNYFYGTAEQRDQAVNDFINSMNRLEAEKQAEKEKRSQFQANLVNPFKVGDLLYDSWGWEQTNIDFYQVVEVGKKSVVIRAIAANYLRSAGYLCEYISPKKDEFIGEPIQRNLRVDRNGVPHISSPRRSGAGWLSNTEEGHEHYQSHYA